LGKNGVKKVFKGGGLFLVPAKIGGVYIIIP